MATTSTTRRVLVTGAGSGIGRALCERLSRDGDLVIGTVRDAARARTIEREVAGRFRCLPLELSDEDSIVKLADAVAQNGPLDVLIHNAGMGVFGPVEAVAQELVLRQFKVNLLGPLSLTRALLPLLRERRGLVLWIGSLAGRFPLPFQAHYSATKAAIAALSDAMRVELRPLGVRVTCIEPGDFNTGFTAARHWGDSTSPVAYAERLARCREAIEASEGDAPAAASAADVIARVTRNPNPPARVVTGRWARTLGLLHRLLPQRLVEAAIRRTYRV